MNNYGFEARLFSLSNSALEELKNKAASEGVSDFHSFVFASVMGKPISEVTPMERARAKNALFGHVYGRPLEKRLRAPMPAPSPRFRGRRAE